MTYMDQLVSLSRDARRWRKLDRRNLLVFVFHSQSLSIQLRPQQAIKNRERSILEIAIDDLEEVSRVIAKREACQNGVSLISVPHTIAFL